MDALKCSDGPTDGQHESSALGLRTGSPDEVGVSLNEDTRSALINPPLQWGVEGGEGCDNRFNFNGFPGAEQTVETVMPAPFI